MRSLFRRLRVRLTIACSLVTGLVLVGMALASLHFSESQLRQRTEDAFRSSLNAIFLYLRDASSIDQAWLSQTETSGGLEIYLEDRGQPLLYGKKRDNSLFALAAEKALREFDFDMRTPPDGLLAQSVTFRLPTDNEYLAAVGTVPLRDGWLGIAVVKPIPQIRRLRLLFAECVCAAFVCLVVFAWFFTDRAVRPVEESRRRQMEFVSAASHELRSPLAVMRASADAMQDAPPEQTRRFARTISEECARLSRLTADLLTLAGTDNSRWSLELDLAEPETLLLLACESFEPVAAKKQISIRAVFPEDPLPRIRCDPQRIEQLLAILLDNAVSYTPQGGRIVLSASVHGRSLSLSVADSGPGIPDIQKPRVFERFYRADTSRSKKEHYGLGLSIAWEIARLHKGSLTVSDAPGGGAAFTLALPLPWVSDESIHRAD